MALDLATYDPVRTKSDEAALRQGYYFDREAAALPCSFIETFCGIPTGLAAGEPFVLLDWQRRLTWDLYGWVHTDTGRRRYREAYVTLAKKSGKSLYVSALILYALMADGEESPEIHLNAVDRSQAGRLYDEARKMIAASPALSSRLKLADGVKRIEFQRMNGVIRTNSADVDSKDGASSSFTCFDELHLQNSWKLWDVFRYAGISRRNPLTLSITTAGINRDGPCWDRNQHAWRVLDGEVVDLHFLPVVYGPRPGVDVDVDDPEVWRLANPSLGVTTSLEDFRSQLEEAKRTPAALARFKRYRLNAWVSESGKFFNLASWNSSAKRHEIGSCLLAGMPCWAGLDVSSTSDLTALAVVFYDPVADEHHVFTWCWCPQGEADRRAAAGWPLYQRWADEGRLELTDGPRIDYARIAQVVAEVYERTKFKVLNLDSYNVMTMGTFLGGLGVPHQEVRKGWRTMSQPTKEYERRVTLGKIRHGREEDPVLTWCMGNAVPSKGEARGNVTLDKERSSDKIDAVDAVLNGFLGWMDEQAQPDDVPLIGVLG
ncbi:terminase large subunit [Paludisphaera rhizosphaerae]|uniref:terminase large subunit n=1 Tax=Paludisphaera rhizosphaerae TaxID=2711216 RepID=UPI0013EB73DF|nr:terminase TerL endonuclease subunit [Paludisphaera rhizosphaerae]